MSLAETDFLGCNLVAPAPPPGPALAPPYQLRPAQVAAAVFATLLGAALLGCLAMQWRRGACNRKRRNIEDHPEIALTLRESPPSQQN